MGIANTFHFKLVFSLIFSLSFISANNKNFEELIEISSKTPVISLTNDIYRRFIKSEPRNYSSIVVFTTLDSGRGCRICSEAHSEFQVLAQSSLKAPVDSRVFFFLADYDSAHQVFSQIGIDSAPVFIHFPAKRARSPADTFDFNKQGFSAEVIAKWVLRQSGHNVVVNRPPNYIGGLLVLSLVILSGLLVYFKRQSISKLFNKSFWTFISMSCIFYMISGQVWNHIRGPALIQANQKNELIFVYPGAEYQYVLETMLVMLIYIAITGGVILLQEMVNTNDLLKRRAFGIVGLIFFALSTSLLVSVFRRKYPSYPYRLFLG